MRQVGKAVHVVQQIAGRVAAADQLVVDTDADVVHVVVDHRQRHADGENRDRGERHRRIADEAIRLEEAALGSLGGSESEEQAAYRDLRVVVHC